MGTGHRTTDVAIIGGGPSGVAAGIPLARAGLRVTIFEKDKFPRFCIGESLLPHGNDALRELGVWDKLENAGYLRKYGADFCSGDGSRTHRFWFKQSLGREREYSFQVDRASFDRLLLDHAAEQGCEVLEQTRVTGLKDPNTEDMRLTYSGLEGEGSIGARWVIDASGRSAFAGARIGFRRSQTLPSRRVAIYGHFEGVERNTGKAAGHIAIVRLREAWFWFIPLADGRTSVGVVVPTAMVNAQAASGSRQKLEVVFRKVVEESSETQRRLARARAVAPLVATGDYSWRFSSFAASRILLTGDAAGFLDPVFSSGVTLAFKSGLRAAGALLKAEAGGRALSPSEQAGYTREMACWMRHYSKIIRLFYTTGGFEVFMSPAPLLGIPKSIGRLVGGETTLGIADRLRLWVFRCLCRLQEMIRIVPVIRSLR